jgi:hypothetical protein
MAKQPSEQQTIDRFKRRQVKPNRCWYVRAKEALTPDQMAELDAALADPSIQSKTISIVLAEDFDFQISSRTVGSHRLRECNCE